MVIRYLITLRVERRIASQSTVMLARTMKKGSIGNR